MHMIFIISLFVLCSAIPAKGQLIPELPSVIENSTNAECEKHSKLFVEAFSNGSLWAYKMWDSSARRELGLSSGSKFQLGNFDECFDNEIPFPTEYCLIKINIKTTSLTAENPRQQQERREREGLKCPEDSRDAKMSYSCDTVQDIVTSDTEKEAGADIRWAICKPLSCDLQETASLLEITINSHHNLDRSQAFDELTYTVQIEPNDCQQHDRKTTNQWTTAEITFATIITILIVLVTIGTALELTARGVTNLQILNCFSAKTSLTEITRHSGDNPLNVLHGLRVLLMLGILSGHSLNTTLTGAVLNRDSIEETQKSLLSLLNLRGDTAVDVFLMLGGFLAAFSQLGRITNPLKLILNRYCRLVPILALTVLYYATFFERRGSGPLWKQLIIPEVDFCRKNWWTNVLMVNNYVDTANMCVMPSWYLPVDFHMYVISIPLCCLLRRKPFWGCLATVALCGICMGFSFLIVYQYDVHPFYLPRSDFFQRIRLDPHFRYLYIPTHTRGGSYLVGILAGAAFSRIQRRQQGIEEEPGVDRQVVAENPFKISPMLSLFGLAFGGLCLIGCTLLSALFLRPAHQSLVYALYGACHRVFYATMAAGLILILCYTSLDRLRQCLACRLWTPFSRLTFGVYIFHLSIQQRRTAEVRSPVYASTTYLLSSALYEMIISFGVSLAFYILVEGPFTRIPKLCFSKSRRKYATENRANVKIEMDTSL